MREWGYKLDKHGEQGLESCHAEFNRIKDSKRRIRNPNLRLMSAMKDYYTSLKTTQTLVINRDLET